MISGQEGSSRKRSLTTQLTSFGFQDLLLLQLLHGSYPDLRELAECSPVKPVLLALPHRARVISTGPAALRAISSATLPSNRRSRP